MRVAGGAPSDQAAENGKSAAFRENVRAAGHQRDVEHRLLACVEIHAIAQVIGQQNAMTIAQISAKRLILPKKNRGKACADLVANEGFDDRIGTDLVVEKV